MKVKAYCVTIKEGEVLHFIADITRKKYAGLATNNRLCRTLLVMPKDDTLEKWLSLQYSVESSYEVNLKLASNEDEDVWDWSEGRCLVISNKVNDK